MEANSSALQVNSWKHICAVYQGQVISVYINGLLANSGTTGFSALIQYPSTQSVAGTTYLGGGQYPFSGLIDDIAIYNRALTQEEITSLYNGEPANPPTACNPLPSNLQNGLVGYWPFCGNANDESGNGNDGTVNGATLTEDRFGAANAAYDFDGNDVIENNNWSSINGNQEFTVNFWTKYQPSLGWLVSFGQPSNTNAFHIGTAFQESNLYSSFWNFSFNPTTNNYPVVEIDSSWTMVSVIYDNDTIYQHINGQQASSFSSIDLNENLLNGELNFGKQIGNYSEYFQGTLDDIGIWNRALSAEELQQLYTLNACTFTIYDTVIVNNYVTIYDTISISVTDTLIINTIITTVQPVQENTFLVYPNPANSHITIDYGNFAILNGYQLKIENSLGQQVFQTNITQQTDYLSLNNWGGNGLYFVHIIDAQGNTIDIRKIVLQ